MPLNSFSQQFAGAPSVGTAECCARGQVHGDEGPQLTSSTGAPTSPYLRPTPSSRLPDFQVPGPRAPRGPDSCVITSPSLCLLILSARHLRPPSPSLLPALFPTSLPSSLLLPSSPLPCPPLLPPLLLLSISSFLPFFILHILCHLSRLKAIDQARAADHQRKLTRTDGQESLKSREARRENSTFSRWRRGSNSTGPRESGRR